MLEQGSRRLSETYELIVDPGPGMACTRAVVSGAIGVNNERKASTRRLE